MADTKEEAPSRESPEPQQLGQNPPGLVVAFMGLEGVCGYKRYGELPKPLNP